MLRHGNCLALGGAEKTTASLPLKPLFPLLSPVRFSGFQTTENSDGTEVLKINAWKSQKNQKPAMRHVNARGHINTGRLLTWNILERRDPEVCTQVALPLLAGASSCPPLNSLSFSCDLEFYSVTSELISESLFEVMVIQKAVLYCFQVFQ